MGMQTDVWCRLNFYLRDLRHLRINLFDFLF